MPNLVDHNAKYVFPCYLRDAANKFVESHLPWVRTGSYWSNHSVEIVKINGLDAPEPPKSPRPPSYEEGSAENLTIKTIVVPVVKVVVKSCGPIEPVHIFHARSTKVIFEAGQEIAKMFHRRVALVTQYYHDANPARNKELRFSLCSNMKNFFLDEIYLLQNGKEANSLTENTLQSLCDPEWNVSAVQIKKVTIIEDSSYPERIRFSDLFEFCKI